MNGYLCRSLDLFPILILLFWIFYHVILQTQRWGLKLLESYITRDNEFNLLRSWSKKLCKCSGCTEFHLSAAIEWHCEITKEYRCCKPWYSWKKYNSMRLLDSHSMSDVSGNENLEKKYTSATMRGKTLNYGMR